MELSEMVRPQQCPAPAPGMCPLETGQLQAAVQEAQTHPAYRKATPTAILVAKSLLSGINPMKQASAQIWPLDF